jgi:urease accessory protein
VIGGAAPTAPALTGSLTLRFTATHDRTVLSHADVVAPLKIVRPFHLEDGRLLVQMLALGPGLCGGDAYTVDVTVETGARVVLVAQSATRVLASRADDAPARQDIRLRVRSGGQLEYYPGLVIPYPGSALEQRLEVALEADARLGVIESFAMGRTGRGEYLRFRRLLSRTIVTRDGAPLYRDGIDLQPQSGDVAGMGVLEGFRYVASGYFHGAHVPPAQDEPGDGVLAAVGEVGPDEVYVRTLAADGCQLAEWLQKTLRALQAQWGLLPIPLQRFTS